MKLKLLGALIVPLLVSTAHAGRVIEYVNVFNSEAIASLGSATTAMIDLDSCNSVPGIVVFPLSPGGTPNIKLEWADCHPSAPQPNGTPIQSCEDFATHADLVAASATDFASPETANFVENPGFLSHTIKIKATGVSANPADTILSVEVVCHKKH